MEKYFYEDLENWEALTWDIGPGGFGDYRGLIGTKLLRPHYSLTDPDTWQIDEDKGLYTSDEAAFQAWQDVANAQAVVDDFWKNELNWDEYYIKYPYDGDTFTLAERIKNGEDVSAYIAELPDEYRRLYSKNSSI